MPLKRQLFIHKIKTGVVLFDFQASHRVDPLSMGTNVGVQTVQGCRAHGLDGWRCNGEKNRHLRLDVQVPQRASFISLKYSHVINALIKKVCNTRNTSSGPVAYKLLTIL